MQSPAVDTMDKYNENLTDVKEIFRKGDLRAIPKPLLKWYDNNRRILPWREDPAPYRVWVSEIMLQQTRVEAVKPYFQRFMETLPDIAALAQAPEEVLLKLWEGLGYYNRVRNLQKAAIQIMEDYGGVMPDSYEELLKLKGIGSYTAGAVSSIAYGKPNPAVDGNVLRVIARVRKDERCISEDKVKKAVEKDVCGRAADVQKEIQFVLEREQLAHTLVDLQEAGKLPLRVTHNDTKLNNIMIDNATHKGICVIDLDTVMPGLSLNDFGDSIRFGASTAAEDEQDISKVFCDLHLFDVYVKGFLKGCGGALTDLEVEMLPMGAVLMTFECGMRFLADHLEGDHYFRIHRENQNLDRARTQFKLVWDMEQKLSEMKAIVEKYK